MAINNYSIWFTTNAKYELLEIYEYISNGLKSKITADNLMEEIEKKIIRLSIFPYSCMKVRTKPRSTIYRKLNIKNYLILYKIDQYKKRVDIVHIFYSRRDYLE